MLGLRVLASQTCQLYRYTMRWGDKFIAYGNIDLHFIFRDLRAIFLAHGGSSMAIGSR